MDTLKKRIIQCRPIKVYKVWVKFSDGLEGVVDVSEFKDVLAFERAWSTSGGFENVRVDSSTHTITWGEEGFEADINPAWIRNRLETNNGP